MATNPQEWREETVRVAGTDLTQLQSGTCQPVLVLHEELGHPGWLRWHAELARTHTVILPLHPGFGKSPRVEWVRGIRDLAGFYARVVRERNLRPVDVIGFSMGGWLAAEMAACDAAQFRRIGLGAADRIKTAQGEIMDLVNLTGRGYPERHFPESARTPEFAKL